ncbi:MULTISPECIES: phage holin family protein [unclassified Polynucleobacter]|uniref:phage holin family protein n=1 Tax=unclassified Polynucleobacter TaxID=2640945 RepID=UPI001C0E3D2D|nr:MULTISPECIES: phage holin family protein [unclassified Polynucleobacter]MBU3562944.1 phage holin family protein [Polynucleobacter sp. Tro8-14-1]MEA9567572.1 phage holin family protein [Polynucleobacter sp. AP-Nickl1-40-C4]
MSQENLLSSIKGLASTGVSIAQTRLELLSLDVQIARSKFISLLVMIIGALFFLFFGLVMLALLIVIYSWETDRMMALGLLAGAFLSIGLILTLLITQSLRKMPRLFEASITELAKDRAALSK